MAALNRRKAWELPVLPADVANDLIGYIYEAGAFPSRWPQVLDRVANLVGALGGNLIRSTPDSLTMVSSHAVKEVTAEFAAEGWNDNNTRVTRLLERADHPGFLTDSHLHSADELETLPMYAHFLNPRGVSAGAATIVQGARDDAVIVAIEGFKNHPASRDATASLDILRPHLARASVLSAEIQAAQVSGLIEAFDAMGTAVGLLDGQGKLLAASTRFAELMADSMSDGPGRLRMLDEASDARLATGIAESRRKSGISIAVRDRDKAGIGVLHLITARHDARDLFSNVRLFAIIAQPGNKQLPRADIISALYDLSPAEARIARGIASGLSPAQISHELNLSYETVRTQLKRVFAKTSTTRQNELSMLISTLA